MKDDRLEKEFGEYFKGVNTPDNITGDAKKYVAERRTFLPKFLKIACASASFVLVLALSLTVFLNRTGNKFSPSAPNDSANAPSATPPDEADAPGAAENVYYETSLTARPVSAYGVHELDKSLKFITRLACRNDTYVSDCTTYYGADGGLSLVRADVSATYGLNSYQSEIYVEFEDAVYYPLKDYVYGVTEYYNGVPYRILRETAENGEPLFKLYLSYGGVKYYFNITSSDRSAYEKYLSLIIN